MPCHQTNQHTSSVAPWCHMPPGRSSGWYSPVMIWRVARLRRAKLCRCSTWHIIAVSHIKQATLDHSLVCDATKRAAGDHSLICDATPVYYQQQKLICLSHSCMKTAINTSLPDVNDMDQCWLVLRNCSSMLDMWTMYVYTVTIYCLSNALDRLSN